MSGLGKILIALNLLAAGGFLYVSMEGWKIRQELTYAAFRNEVQIRGIPVEPSGSATSDSDRVPFVFEVNPNTQLDSLSKETLGKLIPKGDDVFGGPPVADQTAEVKRVREIVMKLVKPEADKVDFAQLRTFNINLARSGAERDGLTAVFDMLDGTKAKLARADLAFVGRTASQVAALKVLVEIGELGDPQTITPEDAKTSKIQNARAAVARFIRGEIPHGAGTGPDADENTRQLKISIDDALKPNAGDAARDAIRAPGDPEGFKAIAALAVNPLSTKANIDAAKASVLEFVLGKAITASEKEVLTELVNLILSVGNPNLGASVEKVALASLTNKFDEAEAPAAEGKDAKGNNPLGEKARRIAHLLYHIDAHRFDERAPQAPNEARSQWHTRVATIVGLPEYVRAAEIQASEFSEAANRLLALITEEQGTFEGDRQARVQRCLFLYSQWAAIDAQFKQQDAITKENQRLLAERVTERDKLKEELTKGQELAKEALENLNKKQAELFKIQRDLRDAQAALLIMEKELRQLELGSTGR